MGLGRERTRRPLGLGSLVGLVDPTRPATQAEAGSSSAAAGAAGASESGPGGDDDGDIGGASLRAIRTEIMCLTDAIQANNAAATRQMDEIRADVRRLYELTGHDQHPAPDAGGDYFVDPYDLQGEDDDEDLS